MVLEFFDFCKEAKVYYGGDFIYGLSVDFDWQARGLYVSKIKIMSGGRFKKIDMKNMVYMKISREILFDSVVADNLFDLVFAYMTILLLPTWLLGE